MKRKMKTGKGRKSKMVDMAKPRAAASTAKKTEPDVTAQKRNTFGKGSMQQHARRKRLAGVMI